MLSSLGELADSSLIEGLGLSIDDGLSSLVDGKDEVDSSLLIEGSSFEVIEGERDSSLVDGKEPQPDKKVDVARSSPIEIIFFFILLPFIR